MDKYYNDRKLIKFQTSLGVIDQKPCGWILYVSLLVSAPSRAGLGYTFSHSVEVHLQFCMFRVQHE